MRSKRRWIAFALVLFLFAAGGRAAAQTPEVTFLFAQRAEAGNKPVGAVIAHFNTDGVLDLAVGNANSSDVSLLFGNPDGTFQLPFQEGVGATVIALQGGDLDGNGWIDLVVLTSSSVRIFLNDGVAPLPPMQTTNPGLRGALAVRVGLINGDAVPDLAVVNNTSFQVLLGTGTGTFTALAAVSLTTTIVPDTLALGNLDNDVGSVTDMVVHGRNGSNNGEVDVVLGNGDGTFVLPTLQRRRVVEVPYDSSGGDIVVADFNGNGRADVASLRVTGQSYILLGNGEPTTPLLPPVALAATGKHLAVTDLNDDTLLDLAIAQDRLNDIAVMLGNGDGTFTEAEGYATGAAPVGVQVGDIDADTRKDFAAATGASVYSARGAGDGSFLAARNVLAVANQDGNEVVIFLFQAGDRPGVPSRIDLGTSPTGIASGDFNHDGAVDLVTLHASSTDIAVLLGNGNGTFAPAARYSLSDTPEIGLLVGDFNNDGNPDIAVRTSAALAVLQGDGTGGFLAAVNTTAGSGNLFLGPVLAGDFDGDGKLDLLTAETQIFDCGDTFIRLWRGRGDAQFDSGAVVLTVLDKRSDGLAMGEFNGDALLDFALALRPSSFCSGPSLLRVMHGQGNLTFTAGMTRSLTLPPYALLADDVNGDGADDLVVSQILSGTIPLATLALILGNR